MKATRFKAWDKIDKRWIDIEHLWLNMEGLLETVIDNNGTHYNILKDSNIVLTQYTVLKAKGGKMKITFKKLAEWGVVKLPKKDKMLEPTHPEYDFAVDRCSYHYNIGIEHCEASEVDLTKLMERAMERVDVEKVASIMTKVSEDKYDGKAFTFNYMVDVIAKAIIKELLNCIKKEEN